MFREDTEGERLPGRHSDYNPTQHTWPRTGRGGHKKLSGSLRCSLMTLHLEECALKDGMGHYHNVDITLVMKEDRIGDKSWH